MALREPVRRNNEHPRELPSLRLAEISLSSNMATQEIFARRGLLKVGEMVAHGRNSLFSEYGDIGNQKSSRWRQFWKLRKWAHKCLSFYHQYGVDAFLPLSNAAMSYGLKTKPNIQRRQEISGENQVLASKSKNWRLSARHSTINTA